MKKSQKNKNSSQGKKIIRIILILIIIGLSAGLICQEHPHILKDITKTFKEFFSENGTKEISLKSKNENSNVKEKIKENPLNKKGIQKKANDYNPQNSQNKKIVRTDKKEIFKPLANKKTPFDIHSIKGLDLSIIKDNRPSQIIHHKGYTLSHNNQLRISNWVGYELTRAETSGKEKRTNKFVVDPDVKGGTATDLDYKGSGYDRGHMAPAGDMCWNSDAMRESFYFSNMCPQAPSLNRGIWKTLEERARTWAQRDSAIYIVCGPIIDKNCKTMGRNKVIIPSGFYKVILSPYGKKVKAIGFLFKNEGSLESLGRFAVTVDSIETLTGIDFFSQLPDSVENVVESGYDLRDWF